MFANWKHYTKMQQNIQDITVYYDQSDLIMLLQKSRRIKDVRSLNLFKKSLKEGQKIAVDTN